MRNLLPAAPGERVVVTLGGLTLLRSGQRLAGPSSVGVVARPAQRCTFALEHIAGAPLYYAAGVGLWPRLYAEHAEPGERWLIDGLGLNLWTLHGERAEAAVTLEDCQ